MVHSVLLQLEACPADGERPHTLPACLQAGVATAVTTAVGGAGPAVAVATAVATAGLATAAAICVATVVDTAGSILLMAFVALFMKTEASAGAVAAATALLPAPPAPPPRAARPLAGRRVYLCVQSGIRCSVASACATSVLIH